MKNITIKRALLSVSDKTGIVEFAKALRAFSIEILSTGGTSALLREHGIAVTDVAEVTNFPEMMDGRIKTLHPRIHGGILGKRDQHAATAKEHHIDWIDLVVVNLYPFAKTIQNPAVTLDEAIENIDVGGPTMIRAAAKNMQWVGVVVDPADYAIILAEINQSKGLNFALRKKLAAKAFRHTAHYDALIQAYLSDTPSFPSELLLSLEKAYDLRYGENPHQKAAVYRWSEAAHGLLQAKKWQGKLLSYNNLCDANAAYLCVNAFTQPGCVIVKHANPCGAAVADSLLEALNKAFNADSASAFGGIVAFNQLCDKSVAEFLTKHFLEVIVAPEYSEEALAIFAQKPDLRVLAWPFTKNDLLEYTSIQGGMLIQERDGYQLNRNDLQIVTQKKPTPAEMDTMLFAWPILKTIKSNAILIAKNNVTLGVGAGQVSRVDAVDIALKKAGTLTQGAILASDAFFPFRDSIDHLKNSGITAIIQPGGSKRDQEVMDACDEYGIAMVLTGVRCFNH